jgi:hypothetical protein
LRARIGYVRALARVDGAYPAELALGALHLRLGEHADAQRELEAHLAKNPHGPWSLRARNYWARTLDP